MADVLVEQGQLDEALKAYRDSLAIRKKLAVNDPSNAGWQLDLVVSLVKVGTAVDKSTEVGKQEAKDNFGRSLEILRHLDKGGRLPPTKKSWIKYLESYLDRL